MPSSALLAPSDRTLRLMVMTLLASAAIAPGVAMASGDDVIADCVAGQLKSSYSAADYREALADLPTDVAEYTDCEGEITANRDRALSAGGGGTPYVGSSKASVIPPGTGGGPAAGGEFEAVDGESSDEASATTPAATTPQAAPSSESVSDDAFIAVPTAGDGDGGSAVGEEGGIPAIPAALAFAVIVLGIARGLMWWNGRPETLASAADPA